MSFLSYLSHPVLAVASVGGVSLGVALLLFPPKTVTLGSSFSHPFLSSSQINSLAKNINRIEQDNNCEVVTGLETVINRISDSLNYIAVSCKNTGEGNDEILDNKWTALFHKNLLKEGVKNFSEKSKLNIKTATEIQYKGNKYEGNISLKTTFRSQQFIKEEIIGNWKYGKWYIDEKTVDDVTLENADSMEKIYFVHGLNRR